MVVEKDVVVGEEEEEVKEVSPGEEVEDLVLLAPLLPLLGGLPAEERGEVVRPRLCFLGLGLGGLGRRPAQDPRHPRLLRRRLNLLLLLLLLGGRRGEEALYGLQAEVEGVEVDMETFT